MAIRNETNRIFSLKYPVTKESLISHMSTSLGHARLDTQIFGSRFGFEEVDG